MVDLPYLVEIAISRRVPPRAVRILSSAVRMLSSTVRMLPITVRIFPITCTVRIACFRFTDCSAHIPISDTELPCGRHTFNLPCTCKRVYMRMFTELQCTYIFTVRMFSSYSAHI